MSLVTERSTDLLCRFLVQLQEDITFDTLFSEALASNTVFNKEILYTEQNKL